MRYVLECKWNGYSGNRNLLCHSHVVTSKRSADKYAKISTIEFTDGTTMDVRVRPAAKGERVREIRGYYDLMLSLYGWAEGYVRLEDYYVTDCEKCDRRGLSRQEWKQHHADNPTHCGRSRIQRPAARQRGEEPTHGVHEG